MSASNSISSLSTASPSETPAISPVPLESPKAAQERLEYEKLREAFYEQRRDLSCRLLPIMHREYGKPVVGKDGFAHTFKWRRVKFLKDLKESHCRNLLKKIPLKRIEGKDLGLWMRDYVARLPILSKRLQEAEKFVTAMAKKKDAELGLIEKLIELRIEPIPAQSSTL